jgi:cysteine desulfurase/selenocysteine lyase
VEIASRTGYVKKNGHEGIEAGTPDAAGIIAFGEVLDYLSSLDLDDLWEKESELASAIREQLAKLDVRMVPGGDSPLPVISFDPVFMHPSDLARLLGSMGVCVRSGKHCAHLIHDELGFDTTLRVSLGLYNTEEDAEKLIESLVYLKGRYGRVR